MFEMLVAKIRPRAVMAEPCANCGSKTYERAREGWRCSECKRPKVTAVERMEGKQLG